MTAYFVRHEDIRAGSGDRAEVIKETKNGWRVRWITGWNKGTESNITRSCWAMFPDVETRNLSPDAPRPSGSGVALPKPDSAASAATPKENQ